MLKGAGPDADELAADKCRRLRGDFVVVALMADRGGVDVPRARLSLLERFGSWIAIAVVRITFALAHGLVQAFPELAIFGCALAWLRMRTTSVYPGMLVHGTFNAVALIAAATVHHSS